MLEKHGASSIVSQTCTRCGKQAAMLYKVGTTTAGDLLVCNECLKVGDTTGCDASPHELVLPTTPTKVTGGSAE